MNNTNTNNNDKTGTKIITLLFRPIHTIDFYRYCRKAIMPVFCI